VDEDEVRKGRMIKETIRQPYTAFKPKFSTVVEQSRLTTGMYGTDKNESNGMFVFVTGMKVIISDGLGWDHASVSFDNRCPIWDEMNWIKDLFFIPESCVVQFHPPKSRYINNHDFVLHLWHKQGHRFELPPEVCV
jgi:hypothetical protein